MFHRLRRSPRQRTVLHTVEVVEDGVVDEKVAPGADVEEWDLIIWREVRVTRVDGAAAGDEAGKEAATGRLPEGAGDSLDSKSETEDFVLLTLWQDRRVHDVPSPGTRPPPAPEADSR